MLNIKKIYIAVLCCAVLIMAGCCSVGHCAEKKQSAKTDDEKAVEIELTKEEMVERLNNIFQHHLDIRSSIPGIETKQGDDAVFFEYNGIPLEKLDKNTLFGILRKVNSQLSWKNLQRTQQQLKALKQIENFNKTQKMLRQQRQSVPKTYTPPAMPKKPYTPPKVPKTYKPPKRY